ncbi:MAG: hypothetical protein ACFB21_08000 [Opitutales bacterium]
MNSDVILRFFKQYPVAIIFGLLSLLMLGLIVMGSGDVEAEETAIDEVRLELKKLTTNQQRGVDLTEHVEAIAEIDEAVKARLMDPTAEVVQLGFLLNLEERSNVEADPPGRGRLLETGNNGRIFTKELPQLAFQMSLVAPFQNALGFLYNIRNSRPLMVVDSVRLAPLGNPADREVSMQVGFRALARPVE